MKKNSCDLNLSHNDVRRSTYVARPYCGKQQYTQISLITCLWKIIAKFIAKCMFYAKFI